MQWESTLMMINQYHDIDIINVLSIHSIDIDNTTSGIALYSYPQPMRCDMRLAWLCNTQKPEPRFKTA
jgi:hypothetical protein